MEKPEQNECGRTRTIRLLGREITMPQSRLLRIVIGGLLVFFGCFGFLPVLGFWMIPVGLVILSYEFATVRRWRRRSEIWWAERRGRRRARDRQQLDDADGR
jgi:hypothetical protein